LNTLKDTYLVPGRWRITWGDVSVMYFEKSRDGGQRNITKKREVKYKKRGDSRLDEKNNKRHKGYYRGGMGRKGIDNGCLITGKYFVGKGKNR